MGENNTFAPEAMIGDKGLFDFQSFFQEIRNDFQYYVIEDWEKEHINSMVQEINQDNNPYSIEFNVEEAMLTLQGLSSFPPLLQTLQVDFFRKDSVQYLTTDNPLIFEFEVSQESFLKFVHPKKQSDPRIINFGIVTFITESESYQDGIRVIKEIVRKYNLGMILRLLRKTYQGEDEKLTSEFIFSNRENWTAQFNRETVTPQMVVIQDHQLGHKFVDSQSSAPEIVPRHFNVRGIYITADNGEVAKQNILHKNGDKYNVEMMEIRDGKSEDNSRIFGGLVGTNFGVILQSSFTNYLTRPIDFMVTIESDGKVIYDGNLLEMKDIHIKLLEELGILHYVELDHPELHREHFFY